MYHVPPLLTSVESSDFPAALDPSSLLTLLEATTRQAYKCHFHLQLLHPSLEHPLYTLVRLFIQNSLILLI